MDLASAWVCLVLAGRSTGGNALRNDGIGSTSCRSTGPSQTGLMLRVLPGMGAAVSGRQADGKPLEGVVQIRPDPHRFARQLDGAERVEQFLEEHLPLESGQMHAKAEVAADAEGQ